MKFIQKNSIILDKVDKQIIKCLSEDARVSISELAAKVNLSATPCNRRVKQLEEAGIITGYHTKIDMQKLGYNLSLFIAVSMDKHTMDRFSAFEEKIQEFDEIISCSIVTGRTEDYLLKVIVKDMSHYEEFLLRRLNKIEGVSQVHTSFELREVFSKSIF